MPRGISQPVWVERRLGRPQGYEIRLLPGRRAGAPLGQHDGAVAGGSLSSITRHVWPSFGAAIHKGGGTVRCTCRPPGGPRAVEARTRTRIEVCTSIAQAIASSLVPELGDSRRPRKEIISP